MRKLLLAATVVAIGLVGVGIVATHISSQERKLRGVKDPIPNRYIVVLEDWAAGERGQDSTAELVADELSIVYGGRVEKVYKHALNGYAVEMSEKEVENLSKDNRVKYVEPDGVVSIDATQSPATWGLDRIDQRNLPLSNSYTSNFNGSGVNAYIIDTGVRFTHNEFTGRTGASFDAIGDGQNGNDCNGHGTHVAGTVGSTTYGVAKGVTLHRVRVLNCSGSGSNSGVIAGVDWVTANHVKPAVANMSLGGGASSATDTAVTNSINAGVTYAVAAGNSNANACNSSPARVPAAITVGSTTSSDARSSFSNYGTCLDIFAPGSSITSAWNSSNTATNTISGTSMASPHVAGVAALYLAENGHQSASTVRNAIVNNATAGVVGNPGSGSPNLLLYSLFGAPPPTPTPTPTPTPGAELIVNGGFETSASPWVFSGSGAFYCASCNYPHTGSGYSYFGVNNGSAGAGQAYQTVTLPASAAGTFTFWLNVASSETTTSIQYDKLFVEVRSTSGALLSTVATYSNLNKTTAGNYSLKSFNLAAFRGQTVRIQFRSTMDSSITSTFRVDDVSLQ